MLGLCLCLHLCAGGGGVEEYEKQHFFSFVKRNVTRRVCDLKSSTVNTLSNK